MFSTIINYRHIPLKIRLMAWWYGYDIADIERKLRADKEDPKQASPAAKDEEDEEDKKILWDKERVEATQIIWGDGFCGPGGPKNVVDMSKLLALSPKLSALVIGAGLGGPSRVLAREFGVWINGYENNEMLAQEGMRMSTDAGMAKKAPITFRDLNNAPVFDRNFDRAFSKEALYTVERKSNLIQGVFNQLKEDSLFLISDYVVRSHDSLANPAIIEWIRHEPQTPYPVTAETMVYTLEKVGFTIRVHENTTAHYIALINAAWANAEFAVRKLAEEGETGQKKMQAIMQEAKLWRYRAEVMRQGELQVCRYLAHKPIQEGGTADAARQ